MAGLKLHSYVGNFRAFKELIAAEYNGIDIDIPKFEMLVDNKKPEFLAMSPQGRVPVLETPSGSICESNSIARYIARMRRDTELIGATLFEEALVDQWIEFCSHDLELPATLWFYPVIGYMPFNAATTAKAKVDLEKAFAVLESHLKYRSYLVGNKVTLADITIVSTLLYPMKIVLGADFRAAFPCVMRWFTTCVNQPEFKAVVGTVTLAKEEMTAVSADAVAIEGGKKGKKEKKEKAPKADKPKKEKKEKAAPAPAPAPAPKKEDHPLKVLDKTDPSPFVMDTWKKEYSNCVKYEDAMEWFWNNFDDKGYSLWLQKYKYNSELKVLFKACNMCGTFLQYNDSLRKWCFGTMWIVGDAQGEMEVYGLWLTRSTSIEHILEANFESEMYDWEKIPTPVSDADKKKVFELWCSEDLVMGKPQLDYKCFK